MSETNTDEVKGRVKEAAGALTGDEELKEEGQADQVTADVKDKIDEGVDKVKDGIDSVKDRFTGG